MTTPAQRQQYQLLNVGNFRKWEQVGPFVLERPSAQAVWPTAAAPVANVDARFHRHRGGDGEWEVINEALPNSWPVDTLFGKALVRLTDFGHIGLFPEHQRVWEMMPSLIRPRAGRPLRVLNLFAYTGGVSLAAARCGAHVVHVDASKTSVEWARENAALSQADHLPIRWLVDDVTRFVTREIRRERKYDGVILDPPSYGRGPKGEQWKIEEHLNSLIHQLAQLRDSAPFFCILSAHTPGYTPLALHNILTSIATDGDHIDSFEMTVPSTTGPDLPAGAVAILKGREL